MQKHREATLALRAQFPEFKDWITNNLTPEQLVAVMYSKLGTTSFGGDHPLNDVGLGAQLYWAYEDTVKFCAIEQPFWHYPLLWFPGAAAADEERMLHGWVCLAMRTFGRLEPEVLDLIVQRHRRELEAAMGPGHQPGGLLGISHNRPRL
jgi:hypothetical protein